MFDDDRSDYRPRWSTAKRSTRRLITPRVESDAPSLADLANPYKVGQPIMPGDKFFGREDVFDFIRQHLHQPHQDSVIVIYGQMRTGKTSILYQLAERLGDDYVCVLVDLQGKADPGIAHFLYSLALDIWRVLQSMGFPISQPDLTGFSASPTTFFEYEFLQQVCAAIGNRRLLLMIDELNLLEDRVAAQKLEPEIFPFLRHLMQHVPSLSFIFCGSRKLEEMAPRYWAIFNVAGYKKITFLEKSAARALIVEPVPLLKYEPSAVQLILQLTAGHPFLVQAICWEIVEQCKSLNRRYVKESDVEGILPAVLDKRTSHFLATWDMLAEDERAMLVVLQAVATLPTDSATLPSIASMLAQHQLGISPKDISAILDRLLAKDIVCTPDPSTFTYVMGLFKKWVTDRYSVALLEQQRALEFGERLIRPIQKGDLQPALVIGAGGTGQAVLTYLKARLVKRFGEVPGSIRLLAIDTSSPIKGEEVSLTQRETVNIGHVSVQSIEQGLSAGRFADELSWYQPPDKYHPAPYLDDGAGALRPYGRLALSYHCRNVRGAIEDAISMLVRSMRIPKGRDGRPVRVFVINSLCGGTGSGIFIDVGYLVRYVLSQRELSGNLISIAVSADAFDGLAPTEYQSELFQANNAAALAELAYHMTRQTAEGLKLSYIGGLTITATQPPYDLCYVVSGRSVQWMAVKPDSLCRLLADAVDILVATRMEPRAKSVLGAIESAALIKGENRYGAIGLASLDFPVDHIVDFCTNSTSAEIIESILGASADPRMASIQAERFLRAHGFSDEETPASFSRDEHDQPISSEFLEFMLGFPASARDRKAVPASVAAVDAEMAQYQAHVDRIVEAKRDFLVSRFRDDPELGLMQQLRGLLRDDLAGLHQAIAFLGVLEGTIIGLLESWNREIRESLSLRQQAREFYQQERAILLELGQRQRWNPVLLPFFMRRRVVGFVQAANEMAISGTRYQVFEAVRGAGEGLITVVASHRRSLEELGNRLPIVLENLHRAAAHDEVLWPAPGTLSVGSSSMLETFYLSYRTKAQRAIVDLLTAEDLLWKWSQEGVDPPDVATRLSRAAETALEEVKKLRVEDAIHLWSDRSMAEWITSLRRAAEPLRPSAVGMEPETSRRFELIGVEDAGTSELASAYERETEASVSTGHRHRITVLKLEYGLPLSVFTDHPDHWTAYRKMLDGGTPLHIFGELPQETDMKRIEQ